jgi:hypothetical protein
MGMSWPKLIPLSNFTKYVLFSELAFSRGCGDFSSKTQFRSAEPAFLRATRAAGRAMTQRRITSCLGLG